MLLAPGLLLPLRAGGSRRAVRWQAGEAGSGRVQYIADDGHAGPFWPAQQVPLPCRCCAVLGGAALALLLLLP